MKLFNCFSDCSKKLLLAFNELHDTYYAHLSHDKKQKETLTQHSVLVSNYCLRLIKSHNIDSIFDSTIQLLITQLPVKNETELGNLLKEIFLGAVIYHDLGKVNPNFQFLKMENGLFAQNKKLSFQSNHSLLGAYLYSNIFFRKVFENDTFEDDEKLILYFSIILFGGAIIKHHNPAIAFTIDFDNRQINDCYSFLQTYHIYLDESFSSSFFIDANLIFEDFHNTINNKEVYFNLFATTKLLYSLLTASDFYATNEFMTKAEIIEFGTLNNKMKKKLVDSFETVKPYNRDLYSNLTHYSSLPFIQLTERNNQNLNILRQKLTAEMIFNLRAHSENKCFYIEAPTGAGKTNLSLAFATELIRLDASINKIFYVFPFTTLITQTFKSIKETLAIDNNSIIQLHSKAGFHEKEDGFYGNEKRLFIDNLFVNYPISLMSHIHFFDILKGNEKESNYLLHRLCNSIVIIDEIQTYNPDHWDKIVYFLANYAQLFNIRILIMSATLPKIDALHENIKGTFVSLIPERNQYFTNPNFAGRVSFDFTLSDKGKPEPAYKKEFLSELSDFMLERTNEYALNNDYKVKVLAEFITKKTASVFFEILRKDERFEDYKILLLSGDILEFRRKEIIHSIKNDEFSKVIIVSTQVVEAGVDIDMDLGFKDRSLIDSDEQLAGRINRNASKHNCVVYLFDCDNTSTIYGLDSRYKIQQTDKEIFEDYKEILTKKLFHALYEKVFKEKMKSIRSIFHADYNYYRYFEEFDFPKIHNDFELIKDNNSQQLFIPVLIPVSFFDSQSILESMEVLSTDGQSADGEKVFSVYEKIICGEYSDFVIKTIDLKKIGSIISQFCISVSKKQLETLSDMLDPEKSKYGYKYLLNWEGCYSPENGFNPDSINTSVFL